MKTVDVGEKRKSRTMEKGSQGEMGALGVTGASSNGSLTSQIRPANAINDFD